MWNHEYEESERPGRDLLHAVMVLVTLGIACGLIGALLAIIALA